MSNRYKEGQRIRTTDGKEGIIRYVGELVGKPGNFVGIELEEPLGKNDGSVDGQYYFECEADHGIFYKTIANLTILEDSPKPAVTRTASTTTARAPVNGRPVATSRPSAVAPATARTARPSLGGPNVRKPSLSAAPPLPTSTTAVRQAIGAPSRRLSTAPSVSATAPSTRTSRPSLAARPTGSPTKSAVSTSRLSTVGTPTSRSNRTPPDRPSVASSRTVSQQTIVEDDAQVDGLLQPPTIHEEATPVRRVTQPSTAASRTAGLAEKKRQLEAQQTEKRRTDDKERAKELDQLKEKTEQFEKVNEKLQSKCRTQMEEIKRLKSSLQEREQLFEQLERTAAEHDTFMEEAVLDKEMAEEREASARHDLDSLKSAYETAVEELMRMKEHYDEMQKDMTPEQRAAQGWLHMERENERLKEALIRLRDRTSEMEADMQLQIDELETDNEELLLFRQENDESKVRLLQAESQIEDLREQLETAEGAETMIEQLTDRNALITDRVEELQIAVDDLQNLKEIHDEIEESYNEQVRELEDLLNTRDLAIADFTNRAVAQKEELDDREYTIGRFRDLVAELQASLDDLRASKELTETQHLEFEGHHRAMMDFNRQLQASAASHKLKTIDLELRKMEAAEAAEQLRIMQLFLPEAYQDERDSVFVLLRFQRVAFKARLLHTLVKENLASQGVVQLPGDRIVALCDALDKLAWIAAMSDRFAVTISSCSLDEFARFQPALYELEPVERTLNEYVDAVKNDSLQEAGMVDGLQRSIAVINHLSVIHLEKEDENSAGYADEVLMKTKLMHGQLESIVFALAATRKEASAAAPSSAEDSDQDGIVGSFISKLDHLAIMSRGAKNIAGKVLKQLNDLHSRSMSLNDQSTSLSFETSANITQDLATNIKAMALGLHRSVHERTFDAQNPDAEATSAPSFDTILTGLRAFNAKTYNTSTPDPFDPLIAHFQRLHTALSTLYTTSLDLTLAHEFSVPNPPWVQRSLANKASKEISATAEEEITRIRRDLSDRTQAILLRDQRLEELGLKTEMLEAKMRESSKKVGRVDDLEQSLSQAQSSLAKALQDVAKSQTDITKLTEERDSWIRKAAEAAPNNAIPGTPGLNGQSGGFNLVGTSAEMDALKAEIAILQETTRYLRRQNRRQRTLEDTRATSWLAEPLGPSPGLSANQKAMANRQESLSALRKIMTLPENVKPLILEPLNSAESGGKRSRLGWRPMKMTARWQLSEMEVQWMDVLDSTKGRRARGSQPVIWRDTDEESIEA